MPTRSHAAALDRRDPLAEWRGRFVDPGVIYLDGNSLGMAPVAVGARIDEVVRREWGIDLIRSWDHWIDMPARVGDRLAPVIGAVAGTVVVHDSTTVNLYQAVHAALGLAQRRSTTGRAPVIAVDARDFPTDRYVVRGIARATGAVVAGDDDRDVDVIVRSLVDYRTGALADLAAETARARDRGTTVVWDLCHAAGATEVDVDAAGVDLAVGCSYKYLNGGPGAPAWTYVRPDLHGDVEQPIWGWWAQRDQFEMADPFDPVDGPRRFLLGTPNILGLAAAEVGIGLVADAGMDAIVIKARALTTLALELCDEIGLPSPTPRQPERRGAHVSVRVPADRLDAVHAGLVDRGVIVEKRRPDLIRVGCSPLTTRFVDVFDGVSALADALHSRAQAADPRRCAASRYGDNANIAGHGR